MESNHEDEKLAEAYSVAATTSMDVSNTMEYFDESATTDVAIDNTTEFKLERNSAVEINYLDIFEEQLKKATKISIRPKKYFSSVIYHGIVVIFFIQVFQALPLQLFRIVWESDVNHLFDDPNSFSCFRFCFILCFFCVFFF